MDQAADSLAIARRLKEECPRIGSVYESSMQDFDGHKEYNCIVLRYVSGYLDDKELERFLSRLGNMLARKSKSLKGPDQQESYIIVQEQVLPEGESHPGEFGQRVRTERSLEAIFYRTNLDVAKTQGPESLIAKYHDVKMWALALSDIGFEY